MKINSITISNFQSYYNEQTIRFGEGLNLIIGNGGKGKSKLFNAFYWVLFGKIYVTDQGWCSTDGLRFSSNMALYDYEFINKKALHDAKVGETIITTVSIELTDEKRGDLIIERTASTKRKEYKDWDTPFAWSRINTSLKVGYDSDFGTKTICDSEAEGMIIDLFPEEIRGYIWFQGETLSDLINFRDKGTLVNAVKHISYYPYYENMTKIITEAQKILAGREGNSLKDANKKNEKFKGIISNIETYNAKIEIEERKKEKYEKDKEVIKVALAEDNKKMEGLAGFAKLTKDYGDCKAEIKDINYQLEDLEKMERRYVPNLWILRGIDKLIVKSQEIISSYVEEENNAPERKYIDEPSKTKLEEILYKDHRCFVCGSPVDDAHREAVDWIMNRLREQEKYYEELDNYKKNLVFSKQFNMFVGTIKDYPDSLLRSLKSIDSNYMNIEDESEKLKLKRKKLHEKKDALDAQIEDVKKKHGVDPIKESNIVPTLSTNITVSQKNLERLENLITGCDKIIDDYKTKLEFAEREKESIGNRGGAVTSVAETEWKNIALFLEPICKKVQENARIELREKLVQRANEIYKKFTEHDDGYKGKVEVDSNYTIKFDGGLNTSHEDRKKMSIINALLSLNQEAMEVYYPFISDAPTSSFDPTTTHKYLMGIKDIFGQSIIMTKDVEVGSDKYVELYNEHKVSKIYLLESQTYCDSKDEPEIFEVSSRIKTLK